ncbi:uncharacterized protein LOC119670451 [Teleopsis dalmanni]|uniref:uncharacterized protein LOC119670451 n=1 Tax=Teleopsis dalmanni TaxID=139649 RepID=UPI0018CCE6A4|nr:uncharacterized protein LOC119670451 [Teleopsis dalmanni]
MKLQALIFLFVTILLLTSNTEAKKKKKNKSDSSTKTKTKTKWSSSTDMGASGLNSMVATEEHGYYVKRTYLPSDGKHANSLALQSPPYLGIPIAWFSCEGDDCIKGNTGIINGMTNAFSEGFLCDDDCVEPYEPICGKTQNEVAVFYNKCKLNVAKCRTHGLWSDISYDECKKSYSKEMEYAEKKFKSSPYFKGQKPMKEVSEIADKSEQPNKVLVSTTETLEKVTEKLSEIKENVNHNNETNEVEVSTVPNSLEKKKTSN